MKKITNTAAFCLFSLLVCSCAMSKALYLGEDNYSFRAAPHFYEDTANIENINGLFPEAVYIKTRTQTFDLYHYYVVLEGRIWYKSIDPAKKPENWTLFEKTGLPHRALKWGFTKTDAVAEISADADELVALSVEGNFYRYCFDKTIAHKSNVWLDRQGWPGEEQLRHDPRTAKNLAWALGKRNTHVLYYEDPFGNQHHNGSMEIVTTYMLLEDGQEICYADTGLSADFSRNYTGPERGTFKALSLSASASTMFVINEAGEMYTRLADFDTTGCDPMWFKYTYIPYQSNLTGTDYFSNLNEWGLPAEDWWPQPRIPLAGKARLTRHITILQNGQGNGARELRVAGLNEDGESGYWFKAIFAETWDFKTVPLYFSDNALLKTEDGAKDGRGISFDKQYLGYKWKGNEKESGWEYQIPNFNILEGDCDFLITWRGETCTLKLYPVEMWTYLQRDYLPGRTGSPKMFWITLVIPRHAFDGLSEEFIGRLNEKYAGNNLTLFSHTLAASSRYILMREVSDTGSVLFLTDGIISNQYPDFQPVRHVEDFGEIQRYYSPELTIEKIDKSNIPAPELLAEKIRANKQFIGELKYKIRVLRWSDLTAFKINAGYLPAHYLVRFSPLRFVDVPKLRTITIFGEKIVLANNAYIDTVSNIRIWLYEKMIELLEVRILYYHDLLNELPDNQAVMDSFRYSGNLSDYWDIAGLPRTISGTFFNPGTGNPYQQTPVVLSLVPVESNYDIYGWYFRIEKPDAGIMFIDPKKSLEYIYSRQGKHPTERPVQIDCTLYINNQGINVRIIFDGHSFEIWEHPARHSRLLIFKGDL